MTANTEVSADQPAGAPDRKDSLSTVIVPVGVLPGSGASSLAAAIALRADAAGCATHLIDAACPRRSSLRELADRTLLGRRVDYATDIAVGTFGRHGHVQYLEGDPGGRWDIPGEWPLPSANAQLKVIDLGLSAEELLTTDSPGREWLSGDVEPWVVLVLHPTQREVRRCEEVLEGWQRVASARIADVVLIGPVTPGAAGRAGALTEQALGMSVSAPHDPGLADAGPLGDLEPLSPVATRILSAVGSVPTTEMAPPPRRRLLRRKD